MRILVTGRDVGALATKLELRRHDVEVCEDAVTALRRLDTGQAPRIVLWMWDTPGLGAIEACRELRSHDSASSSWLLIGLERYRHPEAVQALDAGADDILLLPVEEIELDLRLHVARRSLTAREQLLMAREKARIDELTGLWNRAAILELLDSEIAGADRRDDWLGLVLLDIDRFSDAQNRLGEEASNAILVEVARLLRTTLRTSDWVGRSGADRFLVLLPGCNVERSKRTAERMQKALRTIEAVTLSLGLSANRGRRLERTALLARAREALRQVKARGGDDLQVAEALSG